MAGSFSDYGSICRQFENSMTIPELKNVIRTAALGSLSGRKQDLIDRIRTSLKDAVHSGDEVRYQRIKRAVLVPSSHASPNAGSQPHAAAMNGYTGNKNEPEFSNTPFYSLRESLTAPGICFQVANARNSANLAVRLRPDLVQKLQDPGCAVLFFCTATDSIRPGMLSLVEFPPQSELRVNGHFVNANLRGMRKQAGTTRPPDITKYLQMNALVHQRAELAYANTLKQYTIVIKLVKKFKIGDIVKSIRAGRSRSKDAVKESTNADNEVQATSFVVSLKCPLSFSRIKLPIRSVHCRHLQCFDAEPFLTLNEQMPTWQCPVCAKTLAVKDIIVDSYFEDILQQTSLETESVVISPDGEWSIPALKSESPSARFEESQTPERDFNYHGEFPHEMMWRIDTPQSSVPDAHEMVPSRKRAADVIDLTLSDEEDMVSRYYSPKKRLQPVSIREADLAAETDRSRFRMSLPYHHSTQQLQDILSPPSV